ncbi:MULTISPECIES: nitroreductase family protein [unclassified Clostridium]|uniref:nitroreductase family protein n=1 Tax=unclassified Clostridium TaxID=2614128 RepID=UPI00029766CB|nr:MULTISPECIES: nitroreductase family protein [unclassified Clostridium]EKQ54457.1 MAG: nitroreductase [Clostridium sp. Maddingley MBC34-26]
MNKVLETIYSLHAVHGNFTSKPIEEEKIRTILDACVNAQNASNRQSYSIIVIRGEENVQKIISCGYKAPIALLFCVDFNRIHDIGEYLGYPSDNDNLFSYLTAHTDAVLAAQTAIMAATSLELGTLCTNSIHTLYRKNLIDLYKELNLPDEHFFPVTALLIGYEDKTNVPNYKNGRLKDAGIVHYDTYKKLTAEEKESIIETVNNPENHFSTKGREKGNCDTYLEFYYTKWAPPKKAEVIEKMDAMLYEKLTSFIKK